MAETVRFYREHPYALRLMFGSDHSWRVRQSDVANNALMARELALALGQFFDTRDMRADDLFAIAISLSDAVWSLSFARHADDSRRPMRVRPNALSSPIWSSSNGVRRRPCPPEAPPHYLSRLFHAAIC